MSRRRWASRAAAPGLKPVRMASPRAALSSQAGSSTPIACSGSVSAARARYRVRARPSAPPPAAAAARRRTSSRPDTVRNASWRTDTAPAIVRSSAVTSRASAGASGTSWWARHSSWAVPSSGTKRTSRLARSTRSESTSPRSIRPRPAARAWHSSTEASPAPRAESRAVAPHRPSAVSCSTQTRPCSGIQGPARSSTRDSAPGRSGSSRAVGRPAATADCHADQPVHRPQVCRAASVHHRTAGRPRTGTSTATRVSAAAGASSSARRVDPAPTRTTSGITTATVIAACGTVSPRIHPLRSGRPGL